MPIELQQHLVDAGYTEASVFAFAFSSSQDLDNYLQKIAETDALGDDWLRSPAASSVRWLFHRVSREVKSEDASHSVPTSKSYTSSMDNLLDLAWADLPPARVKEADLIEMKKKFSNKYPSEFLSPTNSPCSRYIAQIAQQQNRGAYHWIPWKEIISESRWLELLEKGKKRQKLEGIILYDATMDLDEDDLSAAPFFINSLLETRSIAMALVGLCHLSQSKKYNAQFMKLYTSRSQDSNLRPANLKEAQSADREFWTDVFALVNESPDSWQVESAIIEVLTVRNSLSVNLMQRPKLLGKGPGLWNPKGKGLGKGKGKKGKHKNDVKSDWAKRRPQQWPNNWATKSEKGTPFCHRFHLYNSCTSNNCRYSHGCPVLCSGKPANSSIDIVSQEHCDPVSFEQRVDTSCTVQPLEILRLMELPSMAYPPPQRCFFELFSGPNAPLTKQELHFGVSCLQPMDIICDPSMDILDTACYEQLLRLAASRILGTVSAAPPCKEYSLLKLEPGGPPPCRTPQHMDSPLVDEPACIDRFFSSQEILHRTITVLEVNFSHGGVSALEQPSSAMSWEEPVVQEARNHFLLHTAEFAHCKFLQNDEIPLQKEWRFVSSIAGFAEASSRCECPTRHSSFSSASTAEYPTLLAKHLCKFILMEDMIVQSPTTISWSVALQSLLPHPPMRFSHIPDGAGLVSSALWPIPYVIDSFQDLRKSLHNLIFQHRLDLKWRDYIQRGMDASPFDSDVKLQNIQIFQQFLSYNGFDTDLSIPEDQPFRLYALHHLAHFIEDPDSTLVEDLKTGVSLGVDSPIPPSGTWPLKQSCPTSEVPSLETCYSNWSSAENQDEILSKLLQDEIDQGFVMELSSEEVAKAQFGKNFAVGKLAIVSNQSGKHRLVFIKALRESHFGGRVICPGLELSWLVGWLGRHVKFDAK